jgi:hypothetical protein
MITASQKRKENIAEYLLYMWQIEDIIRANGLDLAKIEQISRAVTATAQGNDRMVRISYRHDEEGRR